MSYKISELSSANNTIDMKINKTQDLDKANYVLPVDLNADFPELPKRLAPRTQYGPLTHVFALRIPPRTKKVNRSRKERVLLLALIHGATFRVDDTEQHEVIWYKNKLGTGEVVDMSTVQCAVEKISDGKRWWIVDRSLDNPFTYPELTRCVYVTLFIESYLLELYSSYK
ncbi:hypothetical protein FRC12_002497 [Ceratobasidium sp. 428]|nr:hypothetical protein FRC12_002497 [Ceratobasidium sp. 428]